MRQRLLGNLWRAAIAGALAAVTMGQAGDAAGMDLAWAFAVPFVTWLAGAYEVDARALIARGNAGER